MSSNNCGCGNPASSPSKEYMMVAVTASEASTCGLSEATSGAEACAKQEPMYDYSLSDFLLPSKESSTSMEVCNPAIYSIGMWLHFVSPSVALQISNISNKILTLLNRCDDGGPIVSNPDVGLVMRRNSIFVVGSEPNCTNDDEKLEAIQEAFYAATEICVPQLEVASATSSVHPVGRVESDSANLSVGKCLKRIFGIFFVGGTPVLSALVKRGALDTNNFRRLAKHKTGHGVYELNNYSEDPSVNNPARQYMLSVNSSNEKLRVGYLSYPFHLFLEENSGSNDHTSWPNITTTTPFSKDYIISLGSIEPFVFEQGHYWVLVRLEIAGASTSSAFGTLVSELNGIRASRAISRKDEDTVLQYNASMMYCRISTADHKLNLNIQTTVNMKFRYRITLNGIMY